MLVVDSVMGSGKTTWAINHINSNKDRKWLYVTPFLTEVARVSNACKFAGVIETDEGETKLSIARDLIKRQESLVITHSLFVLLDKDDLSKLMDYHLMIDEVLPVTKLLPISSSEINLMFREGFLEVASEIKGACKLNVTTPDNYKKTKLGFFVQSYFEKGGELFLTDNNILAVLLPEFFFKKHKRITVLTYMFENTELACYLNLKQVPIEKKTVVDGQLVDYVYEDGKCFKDLITVINHPKLNEQTTNKNQRYTKAWYSRRNAAEIKLVKNNITNFFKNITKTKSHQNLWTVFSNSEMVEYMSDKVGAQWQVAKKSCKEDLRDSLVNNPYKQVGRDTMVDDGSEAYQKRKCFIPLNCKGTNLYGDRTALAYMVNLNLNPSSKLFFQSTIDEQPLDDVFALNMMTQWLFRGAVRNGEPITVYIPSKRMRHLLLLWLGYSETELF